MATIGVTMTRNERDVIAGNLRHMAGEVDHLIVLDNGSTDGSRSIIAQLATELPVTIVDDPDLAYYQSRKMTGLAELAAGAGATWIVPFDSDELWTHPDGRIRDVLAELDDTVTTVIASLYNYLRTDADEPVDDPFASMVWRAVAPGGLPKVAVRWQPGAVIHQGNHGATLPTPGGIAAGLTVHHYPVRSPAQYVTKAVQGAAALAATDLPYDQGAHWRAWGALHMAGGDAAIHDAYRQHWHYPDPESDARLIRDPAPYRRWER